MLDHSRGTSTQSIINNTERDSEERSVIYDGKRSSVHSNWSGLVPVDMEAEYWRLYNSRKRPDARVCTTTPSAAPAAEAATVPPSSPATHKTIKNIVLVPFTPKPKEWGSLVSKEVTTHFQYCCHPKFSTQRTRLRMGTTRKRNRTSISTPQPLLFASTSTGIL